MIEFVKNHSVIGFTFAFASSKRTFRDLLVWNIPYLSLQIQHNASYQVMNQNMLNIDLQKPTEGEKNSYKLAIMVFAKFQDIFGVFEQDNMVLSSVRGLHYRVPDLSLTFYRIFLVTPSRIYIENFFLWNDTQILNWFHEKWIQHRDSKVTSLLKSFHFKIWSFPINSYVSQNVMFKPHLQCKRISASLKLPLI